MASEDDESSETSWTFFPNFDCSKNGVEIVVSLVVVRQLLALNLREEN